MERYGMNPFYVTENAAEGQQDSIGGGKQHARHSGSEGIDRFSLVYLFTVQTSFHSVPE